MTTNTQKDSAAAMPPVYTRAYAAHQPTWQRFIIKDERPKSSDVSKKTTTHPYNRQYSHMCTRRLVELRPRCLAAIEADTTAINNQTTSIMEIESSQESGAALTAEAPEVVGRIIDLKENVKSTIVGTFLKEMSNRPMFVDPTAALFDDDEDALNKIYPSIRSSTTLSSLKDVLILEDESGRVELAFEENTRLVNPLVTVVSSNDNNKASEMPSTITIGQLTSGGVAAITGVVSSNSGGVMTVQSVAFPQLNPHKTTAPTGFADSDEDSKKSSSQSSVKNVIHASPDSRALRPALDSSGQPVESSDTMMGSAPCLMLISGLQTTLITEADKENQGATSHALRTELLMDFIAGNLPHLEHYAANIARVIIAGNSTGPSPCTERLLRSNRKLYSGVSNESNKNDSTNTNGGANKKARTTSGGGSGTGSAAEMLVQPIKELDRLLTALVNETVPVDILPGREDPTNTNWPQQPLHRCLLPQAMSKGDGAALVKRAPNPYEATIASRVVLGTDGLNIRDLAQYMTSRNAGSTSDVKANAGEEKKDEHDTEETKVLVLPPSEMEVLEQTLLFGHVAPSAPDSLPSFPFMMDDPFILKDTPHVYFAGNCETFESKLVTVPTTASTSSDLDVVHCRLVCVPSFATTQQVVLVNLETLDTECISFQDA
jgi:hypothetical protein